jgi:MipA family protein
MSNAILESMRDRLQRQVWRRSIRMGGLVSYGAGLTAIRPLNRQVTAAFIMNYERIAGDAADSPIVRDLGDADQVSVILSLSYRFGGR